MNDPWTIFATFYNKWLTYLVNLLQHSTTTRKTAAEITPAYNLTYKRERYEDSGAEIQTAICKMRSPKSATVQSTSKTKKILYDTKPSLAASYITLIPSSKL